MVHRLLGNSGYGHSLVFLEKFGFPWEPNCVVPASFVIQAASVTKIQGGGFHIRSGVESNRNRSLHEIGAEAMQDQKLKVWFFLFNLVGGR